MKSEDSRTAILSYLKEKVSKSSVQCILSQSIPCGRWCTRAPHCHPLISQREGQQISCGRSYTKTPALPSVVSKSSVQCILSQSIPCGRWWVYMGSPLPSSYISRRRTATLLYSTPLHEAFPTGDGVRGLLHCYPLMPQGEGQQIYRTVCPCMNRPLWKMV
jgi:hypothetical protein